MGGSERLLGTSLEHGAIEDVGSPGPHDPATSDDPPFSSSETDRLAVSGEL